jgi:HlyD family secretion protein
LEFFNRKQTNKMSKKKSKRTRNIVLIILGLVVIAIVSSVFFAKPVDQKIKVAVNKATKRDIVETVYASGKLFPATEVEISSNVSGTIVELLVEVGQNVKEGQLLAKIDPEALSSMVQRAEATTNSARAQLENIRAQKDQLTVQLNNAKLILDRNKRLLDDGVISSLEFEASETNYKSIQANIQAIEKSILSAQYNVASTDATVREQKKNLSQTLIYAPMSGVVTKVNKKKGEQVVGTIQMAGTPIMNIANLNSIEVRVDVNERDILNVSLGDTADIELDAYQGRKFWGVVTRIANTATNLSAIQLTSDQVTNFEVRVLVSQSSYRDLQTSDERSPFRAGLSASCEIRTNTLSSVLSVPIASVTTREDELDAKKKEYNKKKGVEEQKNTQKEAELKEYVFIQTSDSVAMKEVKTGIQNDAFIQITEGLKEGDVIVVAPYEAVSKKLKAGTKIQVVKEEELYEDAKSWKK